MIAYKPMHRGSWIQFDNEQELKKHVVKQNEYCFSEDDIVLDYQVTNDERDIRYVCVKRYTQDGFLIEYGSPYLMCVGIYAVCF